MSGGYLKHGFLLPCRGLDKRYFGRRRLWFYGRGGAQKPNKQCDGGCREQGCEGYQRLAVCVTAMENGQFFFRIGHR